MPPDRATQLGHPTGPPNRATQPGLRGALASPAVEIAIVVFDGMTVLDAIGPYEYEVLHGNPSTAPRRIVESLMAFRQTAPQASR